MIPTRIYSIPDVKTNVQSQNSDPFGTSVQNVSYHIINILINKVLNKGSVIKNYLITDSYGKTYNVICYSLKMIMQKSKKTECGD